MADVYDFLFALLSPVLVLLINFQVLLAFTWHVLRHPWRPFWRVTSRDTPPECLLDPELGAHKYLKVNNVRLHYVEKGDPSRPLMLFVHGFPEFWYSWRYQIKEFSKDYWVVAVDMRGYGDSDKPQRTSDYAVDNMVDDIRELIRALERSTFTLVAHDWGAAIAWRYVTRYPRTLDRYVAMGAPSIGGHKQNMRNTAEQFWKSTYVLFYQMPWFPEFVLRSYDLQFLRIIKTDSDSNTDTDLNTSDTSGGQRQHAIITDQDLEAYKYTFAKPGALTPPINYYRNDNGHLKEPAKHETSDYPPGLMLMGELDKYVSPRLAGDRMLERFENLQFRIVERANHFLQQDRPELVNAAIRDFLRSS